MKRRAFLKKAAAGLAAGTVAAPAIAQTPPAGLPTIQWRMAASWPKSLDTLFGGAELVAKRVGEITDGKFQIRVFAAGEIVPALQVLDAVQAGTVEMGHTATYYYFGKDPAFALATAVCFGMNVRQQVAWWYFGGGEQALAPLFKDYGCIALLTGNTGCQMGGWWRKEIKSLADLKGVKMRIGGMAGLILAKLGVVPQQLGAPDIYPALEKGTIDAAEWVGPYDDEKLGFNKVAKYYYYPGFWEGGPMLMSLVNEKKWNELPKFYQAALTAACGEVTAWMPAKYDAQNPPALRRLVASGTVLKPFPRAVMEAAEKASYEVYDEMSAKSPHFKRIYPDWKKFRDEQFLWFRVAESTYDNYAFNSKIGQPESAARASAKGAKK
jgi:TRAP-type mannitol/chloroaromatic compound transport system substrate-binding protein